MKMNTVNQPDDLQLDTEKVILGKPRARQYLVTARRGARNHTTSGFGVVREAICPRHNKKSTHFQYADDDGWAFLCKVTNHKFYALPDRSAPKTGAEFVEWFELAKSSLAIGRIVKKKELQ